MEKITPYSVGYVQGYRKGIRDAMEHVKYPKGMKKKEFTDWLDVFKKKISDPKFIEDMYAGKKDELWKYEERNGKRQLCDIKLAYDARKEHRKEKKIENIAEFIKEYLDLILQAESDFNGSAKTAQPNYFQNRNS